MRQRAQAVRRVPLDAALIALAAEPERVPHDLESLVRAAPHNLGERVVFHGLGGLAHRNVRHLESSFPDLVKLLDEARRDAWSNHLTKLGDLEIVAEAFRDLAGGWAVVKGPVLAARVYGRGDLRHYQDVDVLVAATAFAEALDRLESAGGVLLDRNWRLVAGSMRAELSVEVNGRTTVDLHWHLLNEARLRRTARWDMSSLLGRAAPADVGGVTVPVLDRVDALAHIAAHACLSGGNRLIWLKDVERQQATFPVSAPELEERARGAGIWPAVHLGLRRSATTFRSAVPPNSPLWSTMCGLLGFDGFRDTAGATVSGTTFARAARRTVPQSGSAVGSIVMHEQALSWGRRHGFASWLPPAPPSLDDLHRCEGTRADRDDYFRRIGAWSGG